MSRAELTRVDWILRGPEDHTICDFHERHLSAFGIDQCPHVGSQLDVPGDCLTEMTAPSLNAAMMARCSIVPMVMDRAWVLCLRLPFLSAAIDIALLDPTAADLV